METSNHHQAEAKTARQPTVKFVGGTPTPWSLPVAPTSGRFRRRGTVIRLFLTCWIIYALHFATNTVREIYPALSLGDHLSFNVAEYVGLHPDIFELAGHGAFINNNPGASILGALPYLLTRPLIQPIVDRVSHMRAISKTPPPTYDSIYPMAQEFFRQAYARGLDIKFGLAAGVMQVLLMAPLSALSAVVIFQMLVARLTSPPTALLLALLYAFGTPVFYRTAQLNHNLLESHFALFAFFILWRPWDDPLQPRRPNYLLAGLLVGWTLVLDYSGVIVIASLGLYAILRRASLPAVARKRSDLGLFATGIAVCIGLLMAYQWVNFGNPFLPAQHYMPATTFSGYGYRGITLPQPDLLWELAFDIRYGLFTSAPLLLLALFPLAWLKGHTFRLVGRLETQLILGFTIGFFLFTAANQFSRMQFNSGIRHLVPVTPFLFLIVAGVLVRLPKTVALLVGVTTIYWSWCLAMYRDVEQGLGIFESLRHITLEGFQLPWLTTLQRMGYAPQVSAIPLLILCGALLWALWSTALPLAQEPALTTRKVR
ncbi:hypothetical protein BH10CHL1_BH10CHL1_47330 [soil metagenome]